MPDDVDGVTRRAVVRHRARSAWLRGARRADWLVRSNRYPRPALTADHGGQLLHEQRVPLRRTDPGTHEVFEAGKRINVALAAPALEGVRLEPGQPFSFWRAVGRPTRQLGYRHGMELRGGCVIPALGGGLCLLTNALFRAAAELGWDILERHGHTMEAIPSTDEPWGVDATAAWPYIDLRVAVPADRPAARLAVRVDGDVLVLQVWGSDEAAPHVELSAVDDHVVLEDGQRIRRNRIIRRTMDSSGAERTEVIAVNAKRLLAVEDLGRSCLTCDLTGCAGRVEIR